MLKKLILIVILLLVGGILSALASGVRFHAENVQYYSEIREIVKADPTEVPHPADTLRRCSRESPKSILSSPRKKKTP